MAGFLTPRGKQLLLDTLAGAGDYLGLAVGLAEGQVPSLANIQEVTTPGYARKAITWNPATGVDPVFVDNSADVQMGPVTADMVPANYAFLTDTLSGNSLAAPTITADAPASGGTFTAGTYYWRVTATNSRGETITSNEVSATLTANQKVTLSWAAISGATGYKVYRGTAPGAENILVTTITGGSTVSYADTGTAGTAVTPPQVSTAAVGDLLYIWELAEPVRALANKPIYVPASGLIIE